MDEQTRDYLLQKNPNYWKQYAEASDEQDQYNAQNALGANLMKSAAMIGSTGGKVASAAPVEENAQALYKSGKDQLNSLGQLAQRSQTDEEMRQKLYASLQDKEDARAQHTEDMAATQKFQGEQNALKRREMADARARSAQDKDIATAAKDEHETNADFERLGDKISTTRANKTLATEKTKLNTAIHGLALTEGKDPSQMTQLEIAELGGVMAAQVTNGNAPAQQTLEHMTPQTARQDMAKALSYMTGRPIAVNTPEYVNLLKDMLHRQIKTSQDIIASEYAPVLANYGHLRGKNSDRYNKLMDAAGIQMDENGAITAYSPRSMQGRQEIPTSPIQGGSGTAMAATPPKAQEPDVSAYAKSHGITYEQAAAVKAARGGK